MIEQDTAANLRSRVDIGREDLGGNTLQVEGQPAAAVQP